MSFHVQNYLWPITMGNPTRKAVAIALAHYADDYGGNAYPSQATLVERTELGLQTVRRSLRWLVEHEIIAISRHPNQHNSTCYVFVLPEGWTSFRPTSVAPLNGARGATRTPRGATETAQRYQGGTQLEEDKSIEKDCTTFSTPVDIAAERDRRHKLDGIRAALRANDPGITLPVPRRRR